MTSKGSTQTQLQNPSPVARGIVLCVCVCVCVHPWTKGFPPPLPSQIFHHLSHAGALSTPWQTQCNEAMPWSGKHGLITRVYLQQFGTVEHAVQFALLVSMVFHASAPKTGLSATFSSRGLLQLVVAVKGNNLCSNTYNFSDFSPYCSTAILRIVVTESLNTSVRVCFAQPSHSGAECDPRHRGAAFCIGIQQPQRTTSTGPSPEVTATPIESTDALAAGPKHGSFLFHRLSDQSCTSFSA